MEFDIINKVGKNMAENLGAEHTNVGTKLKNHIVRGFKTGNIYYYGAALALLVILLKKK